MLLTDPDATVGLSGETVLVIRRDKEAYSVDGVTWVEMGGVPPGDGCRWDCVAPPIILR